MIFLGFVDDVLDLFWRVKIVMLGFVVLLFLLFYSGGMMVFILLFVCVLLELLVGV